MKARDTKQNQDRIRERQKMNRAAQEADRLSALLGRRITVLRGAKGHFASVRGRREAAVDELCGLAYAYYGNTPALTAVAA